MAKCEEKIPWDHHNILSIKPLVAKGLKYFISPHLKIPAVDLESEKS